MNTDDDNKSDVILVDNEEEILFPILQKHAQTNSNDTRHTNTPKSYNEGHQYISKFVPRDQEDIDDDDLISTTFENNKYNHEEAELDIDQVTITSMSFISERNKNDITTTTHGDHHGHELRVPDAIQEEDEEHLDDDDDNININNHHHHKHLSPHIVDDNNDGNDSGDSRNMSSTEEPIDDDDNNGYHDIDNRSSSESVEFQHDNFHRRGPKFEQLDEDSDLEIETPLPARKDIHIKTFSPQRNNAMFNKRQSLPARVFNHNQQYQNDTFYPGKNSQSRPVHSIMAPNPTTTPWQTPLTPGMNHNMNIHSPSHTTPSPHDVNINIMKNSTSRQSLQSSNSKHSKNSKESSNGRLKLRNAYSAHTTDTVVYHNGDDIMSTDPLTSIPDNIGLYTEDDNPGHTLFSDSQVKCLKKKTTHFRWIKSIFVLRLFFLCVVCIISDKTDLIPI